MTNGVTHREGNQDWVPVGHHTLIENASLAKEVLNYLCIPSVGMKNFYWPCRMETFTVDGIPVILDGCHNHQSVHLFIKSLRSLYPNQEIILLFGAGAEKCVDDMVEEVTNSADG